MQLLLFAFSAGTSLLPCEATGTATGRPHHAAPSTEASNADALNADARNADAQHVASAASAHAHHAEHAVVADVPESASDATSSPAGTPTDAPCPLVVGCIGMMEWTVDVSIRTTESTIVVAAPMGYVLQHTTVARDIASPPPRAERITDATSV